MLGYIADIEKLSEENTNFRRVLYTGPNQQLVLMSLRPGEEIGAEVHESTDQFFRIETGKGRIEIDGVAQEVESGACVIVPAGARHNLICTGNQRMRLYTIYSPPHHKDRLIQATKAEADSSDKSFDGALTEPRGHVQVEQVRDHLDRNDAFTEQAEAEFLKTRTGFRFQIRSAVPGDDDALTKFFSHVTRDDLRFRFLTGMNKIGSHQIEMLTHPNHDNTESFIALTENGSTIVANGMLACDKTFDRGEVAIVIREDHKRKGISWELLSYIARFAETKGVKTLESIESRSNHEAIELERDMGFEVKEYPGDSTLVLVSRSLEQC